MEALTLVRVHWVGNDVAAETVGDPVGEEVTATGAAVGNPVGEEVTATEAVVGDPVGEDVAATGESVGLFVGDAVGAGVGNDVGDGVGFVLVGCTTNSPCSIPLITTFPLGKYGYTDQAPLKLAESLFGKTSKYPISVRSAVA